MDLGLIVLTFVFAIIIKNAYFSVEGPTTTQAPETEDIPKQEICDVNASMLLEPPMTKKTESGDFLE